MKGIGMNMSTVRHGFEWMWEGRQPRCLPGRAPCHLLMGFDLLSRGVTGSLLVTSLSGPGILRFDLIWGF